MAKSSLFEAIYQRLGANFGEFDGWLLPSDFGDPAAEQRAMETGCAAFDLSSFGRISLKSRDLSAIFEGAGFHLKQPLRDEGWVWAELAAEGVTVRCRVGLKGDEAFTLTPSGKAGLVMAALEKGLDRGNGDCVLTDLTGRTGLLALYGPKAVESVKPLLPLDLDLLEPGEMMKLSFFMMNLIIFRGSWVDVDGLELLCPASAAPLAGGVIAKYHEKQKITPAGMTCLNVVMQEAGF